jgi:quinol monooxygenase YgiN
MEHAIIRHLPLVLAAALGAVARPAGGAEPQLAHMVFFTLKDHGPEARRRLVAACHEHLSGHEGTVSFSVGTIAEDVVEPVSDRDFDVALHLLFENKAAIAAYQKSARHQKFIEENKATWSRVRVFDSYLAPSSR